MPIVNPVYGAFGLHLELTQRQQQFDAISNNIELLTKKLNQLRVRFTRAYSQKKKPFWYSFHLRILTLEGVLNAYITLANRYMDRLQYLRVCVRIAHQEEADRRVLLEEEWQEDVQMAEPMEVEE